MIIYILTFNAPNQLRYLLTNLKEKCFSIFNYEVCVINNSNDHFEEYKKIEGDFKIKQVFTNQNLGTGKSRKYIAELFKKTNYEYCLFLEDDFILKNIESDSFLDDCISIMKKDKINYLKLNYHELYFSNNKNWSVITMGEKLAKTHNINLLTQINYIDFIKTDMMYAVGEIFFNNWPGIVDKHFNDTILLCEDPIEINVDVDNQIYNQVYTESYYTTIAAINKNLIKAILLKTPFIHSRIEKYEDGLRVGGPYYLNK